MIGSQRTMAKGIRRRLAREESRIDEMIRESAEGGGMYARGLSGEGYLGGYRDALADVYLLLNGVNPPDRGRGLWRDES